MTTFQTDPVIFIFIVLGFSTFTFLALGARKAFFEPYSGPDET